MPKISKVNKIQRANTSTKPGGVPPEKPKLNEFACARCGKIFTAIKANFSSSQSPLYTDSGHIPVCKNCMDALFDHYRDVLGSGEEAMKRLCMKFDIYWSEEIWQMLRYNRTGTSRVRQYISKTFLLKYLGKTYDDTLDEIAAITQPVTLADVTADDSLRGEDDAEKPDVSPESILFWGEGFDASTYRDLDMRYERWTKGLQKPIPIVEEALYKQICIQESQINKKAASGQNIEQGQNALNNLLSSLNVKPNQKKEDAGDTDLETTPLGVWAKRWEDRRPIPEYDDCESEPKLVKYITTWFYGHLAKALGLKNMYSQVYEDEIARYRVEKPEYEEEDDDQIIADIVHGGDDP